MKTTKQKTEKRNISNSPKCVIYNHCMNVWLWHNSNRSHTRWWKRCGSLTAHLVAVVTAPWRRGSVGWEGSDGRRWILCSCCALLSKEMSCADPKEADGQGTPVMGGCFCPGKRSGWEKGNAGRLPPGQPHYRDERSGEPTSSHQQNLHCIWKREMEAR